MSTPHQSNENKSTSQLPNIILMLKEMEDKRVSRTKKHHLHDILFIALCAIICGSESFEEMEEFGQAKKEWFKKYIELPNSIPSHDTFNRIFQLLNPAAFQECLIRWTQSVRENIPAECVAIDGKAQRRAHNKGETLTYIVNAWATENRLLLGQYKVSEKSNEITAIPELLRILELSNCIITCDAMGCQKNIAKEIIEADADYVLALKGNHEIAHEEISSYLDDLVKEKHQPREAKAKVPAEVAAMQILSEVDKDHGRFTEWHYHQSASIEWFADEGEWEGLKSVGMVETVTTQGGKITREKRYYLSSLELDVKTFAKAVRSHWGVENCCHWVLDVIFKEDNSRARAGNSAQNLSAARGIAMNYVRKETTNKRGIKARVKRAGWDNSYLEQILRII
jgi:predicted transposase YbfD/YdcC